MKSRTWLFAAALSVSGLAMAQSGGNSGVTEITDPARIAAIEQHAKELAARGPATPMMGEHDGMSMNKGTHSKKHRAARHRAKSKAMDKAKDKAAPDAPMATESKG